MTVQGCPDGVVYPVTIEEGSICPPELVEAGIELGCVELVKPEPEPETDDQAKGGRKSTTKSDA